MKFSNFLFTASLIGLALLCSTALSAQNFSFKDGKVIHEGTSRDAIVVVMSPETDEVKEAWEDFMKDRFDIKMKGTGLFSNKDVLYAEDINLATVSSKNMNLYTKVVEQGKNTEMSVFASFGYDIYLNEENNEAGYSALKQMVKLFLNDYLVTFYQEKIETSREMVEDTNKNRTDLQENLAKNKKEIQELMKENEQLEVELVNTKEKLTKLEKELEERNDDFESINRELADLKKN